MGIGAQSKSQRIQSSQPPQNQTYFVAKQPKPTNVPSVVLPISAAAAEAAAQAEEDLPPSYDTSEADTHKPKMLLKPTVESDLDYFHAVAAGTIPQSQPSSLGLVMNLFRTTQTHLSPIDERIALGSSLNTPFYALRSAPSSKSTDEYNLLTISRRNPALASWSDASTSEIQPRLNLHAQGVMIISRIKTKRSTDTPDMWHDLTWDFGKGNYTVWENTGNEVKPKIDIFCEGWHSLDDFSGEGIIRAKSRDADIWGSNPDLAVIDSTKPSTQFISTSPKGHRMMDLLVASMLTVTIVQTRKSKLGRALNLADGGLIYHKTTNVRVRVHVG